MAASEVKGQICDGPIAEIVILGHVLTIYKISCFYHQISMQFLHQSA